MPHEEVAFPPLFMRIENENFVSMFDSRKRYILKN